MSKEGRNEAWVTSAVSDDEAILALTLAFSLGKVETTRKIWIIISDGVTNQMRNLVMQVFEERVLSCKNQDANAFELANVGIGSVVKMCCLRLTQYDKCVYLRPSILVMKFCDELFYHEELGFEMDMLFNAPLLIFEPNVKTFNKFTDNFGSLSGNAEDTPLKKITNIVITEVDYDNETERGLMDSTVLYFKTLPWQLNGNNAALKCWFEIYLNQVLQPLKMQTNSTLIQCISTIVNPTTIPSDLMVLQQNLDMYHDTIAIVGMSCRLPGANNATEYWKLLLEGKDAIRKFPSDRPGKEDKMRAGFLNCPIDEFDAQFFGISPREATQMDPQQRFLLEVTWECLEHAGINPQTLMETDTGVYMGMWQHDYEKIIQESQKNEPEAEATDEIRMFLGSKLSATASRVSFCLGFRGPAVAVESGCSSSLTALHLACESLKTGETSLALVSGVNLLLRPVNPFTGRSHSSSKSIVLSKDFKCKTFDESADGFVRAEACGVVALKRFENAVRDGDKILAVVKGSAINNDGTGISFGTPNAKAQEDVYRNALKKAKVAPVDVSFIETHGTGTAVGDPIELHALGQVYSEGRSEPLLIGSVKTNIGHCEAAAGIASLIKVILCMENGVIPPHLNLKTLNPKIDLDRIPARIPLQATPWTAPTKLAAISCFSMSATNAHVIIQEPPKIRKLELLEDKRSGVEVITFSAKSEAALTALTKSYLEYLKQNVDLPLSDIAYAVNVGRAHLEHRIALIATDTSQLLSRLEKRAFTQGKSMFLNSKIGFLFTGQGSQYFGMTQGLCEAFPAFKRNMEKCDALFQRNFKTSLLDVLFKDDNLLSQTLYCQPAIFCVEYCLSQLWNFFGIKPDCVLGHSVGEFAAAVCAGILTVEDAMKLVSERSRLVNDLPVGYMLAIRASEDQVKQAINTFTETKAYKQKDAWIDIAAVNSSEEVVVSLSGDHLEMFEGFCSSGDLKYTKIATTHAFHSRAMNPILEKFGKSAESIIIGNPTCEYISGTLAKVMEAMEFDCQYWQRHLRDTVRFSNAIQVISRKCKVLVEVGPQPILLSLAMSTPKYSNSSEILCPSIRRSEEPLSTFLTSLSKLYVSGINVDWQSVYGVRQKYIDLPTYPFQRQKYWAVDTADQQDVLDVVSHPLLGKEFLTPLPETIFCQTLNSNDLKYMKDHKVAGCVILPGAAMLECCLAAGQQLLYKSSKKHCPITLEEFVIHAVFPFERNAQIQTLVKTSGLNSSQDEFKYELTLNRKLEGQVDKWKRHATVKIRPSSRLPAESVLNIEALKSSLTHKPSMEDSYEVISGLGVQFGPNFKSISSAWFDQSQILTEINLPEGSEDYICHPILLDAMIQTCVFRDYLAGSERTGNELQLPISIEKFTLLCKTTSTPLYAHTTAGSGSLTLYDATGQKLAIMEAIELIKTSAQSVIRALREETVRVPDFLYEKWKPVLGKTDNRVDISKMVAPTAELPSIKTAKEMWQGVRLEDLEGASVASGKYIFQIFCNAIQKCNWAWPDTGKILNAEQWKTMLPSTVNPGILGIYFYELERQGYLAKIDEHSFKIQKELPAFLNEDKLVSEVVKHFGSEVEIAFARRFELCLPLILQEKMKPIDYLFPEAENAAEGSAFHLYRHGFGMRYQNSLIVAYLLEAVAQYQNSASSNNGTLRILEVGAGSGCTTELCIEALKAANISYHYTFSDISQFFLNEAKRNFGQGEEIDFQLFNIEEDPMTQGLMPEEFDVIIGVQVVHATVSIVQSLSNLKKVLRVGGCLILGESITFQAGNTFTFGMLDGWWRFQDFRLNSDLTACASAEQWTECLKQTQFDNISTISTQTTCGVVAARNASKYASINSIQQRKRKWLILDDKSEVCSKISISLQDQDREVILNDIYSSNSIPVFTDLDIQNFEGIIYFCTQFASNDIILTQHQITAILLGIFKLGETNAGKHSALPKIVLITRGVHSIGDSEPGNPNGASAWGMMKVFRNENPGSRVSLIDLGPNLTPFETSQILAQLWNKDDELFVAVRGNKTFVPRLDYIEKPIMVIDIPKADRYKFHNPSSGNIMDIEIEPVRRQVLSQREVEVEIRACGLNFRDLLLVMKPEGFKLHGKDSLTISQSVGSDFSGVVTALGPDVQNFQVGDRVFAFNMSGALASHTVAPESTLLKMPENMSFEAVATIPVVFMTAIMALQETAKITAQDRVLIHAAAGAFGLAAIQIAKSIGAEIYATAGNPKKRAYLKSLGIKHVYNSRDTTFGGAIERDTNGSGVTVVLNSLTGPNFKETSLSACSHGARFVEVGKINTWQNHEVAALRPDVKYNILDLSLKLENMPELDGEQLLYLKVLNQIAIWTADETIIPLPFVTYPLSKVREAFYYFQKAKHIGKIVIKIPKAIQTESGQIEHKHQIFNSQSSYLITGGLGGLGVEVTKWMLSMGARSIVLLGRNLPLENVQRIIDDANLQGNKLVVIQADIGNHENCKNTLEYIKTLGLPPLRGIMHAAGVLSDNLLINQTPEAFDLVFRPKVYGGWYLHQLTLNYQLEFFVMFSSFSSIMGMIGQGNHAAANRFLDSLAHFRLASGLPATTINWGAWSDVGAAANIASALEVITGIRPFTTTQGIAALEKIMMSSIAQVTVSEIYDLNVLKTCFNQGHLWDKLKCEQEVVKRSEHHVKLVEEIQDEVSREKRQAKIQSYIQVVLQETLSLPATNWLGIDQDFTKLGVDSLMSMEMKNRLQILLGNKTLPMSAMQDNRTVRTLSNYLADLIENPSGEVQLMQDLMLVDSILPEDISATCIPPTMPSECKHILLTGSTGHLGIHCLDELIKSWNDDVTVYCLIRGKSEQEAKEKLEAAMQRNGITFKLGDNINILVGDISIEKLGLSAEMYELLAKKIDGIIHFAAKVDHVSSYSDGNSNDIRTNNVVGTVNILRFASFFKTKSVFFASSILCTKIDKSGRYIEAYPNLSDIDSQIQLGYVFSKIVCEKLVEEASVRGIPVITIRFPQVLGNSVTGHMDITGYNHFSSLLLGCIQIRMIPQSNGVPIMTADFATKLTLQLFFKKDIEQGLYNLSTSSELSSEILKKTLSQDFGINCEIVPFNQWRDALFKDSRAAALLSPLKEFYQGDNMGSIKHFLSNYETQNINSSGFSQKMINNMPDISNFLESPEVLIRLHLRANYHL